MARAASAESLAAPSTYPAWSSPEPAAYSAGGCSYPAAGASCLPLLRAEWRRPWPWRPSALTPRTRAETGGHSTVIMVTITRQAHGVNTYLKQELPTAWLVRDCSPASDHPLYTSLTGAQKRMRLLQQAPLAPTTEDARMTQSI